MRIRYYGHVGQPTGYGHAATETCYALAAAGAELEISTPANANDWRATEDHAGGLVSHVRHEQNLGPADVVIVHTLPLSCGELVDKLPALSREQRGATRVIAYTTWEGSSPVSAAIVAAMAEFDAIWVPSDQNAHCFVNAGIRTPVHVVPHAFDPATIERRAIRQDRHRFAFLYVGAWNNRKNPDGVIRAFVRAFAGSPEQKDVMLGLHAPGTKPETVQLAKIATGVDPDRMPEVRLFGGGYLTQAQLWKMHSESDCFVSTTRGEAWNLPAFDAMLANRHIIHTAGTGADQYLSYGTYDGIRGRAAPAHGEIRIVPPRDAYGHTGVVYAGPQGLDVTGDWIEPDIAETAIAMRHFVLQGRSGGGTEYQTVTEKFSRAAIGALAMSKLEEICKS